MPTVVDTAYDNGQIDSKRIGVSFEPTTGDSANGQLVIGGTDASKYTGHFTTVCVHLTGVRLVELIALFSPITSVSPSSEYVGIDQKISYGSKKLLNSAGVTDTGTTLTLLADGLRCSCFCLDSSDNLSCRRVQEVQGCHGGRRRQRYWTT